MITIKILNPRQVVAQERGRLVARVASYFIDLERRVEEEIVKEIQKVFEERNIKAEISIVDESEQSPSESQKS